MHTKLIPTLTYCNLMFGKEQMDYEDPIKWDQKKFEEFYYVFCLNWVDNPHIQNLIGKLSSN